MKQSVLDLAEQSRICNELYPVSMDGVPVDFPL
jgi:hypothetical protein